MIGSTLSNRYKIVNVLGAGGMGRTYVAEDILRPGNPKCVVKQLRPASTDPAVLTIARRLFGTEAEILERLGNHDQIPRLLAYFEQDQEFFLVQEFIDGHPLSVELPMGQRWSEPQVVLLMQEILGVLAFIHSQNVIHRDIKPDNIIRRGHDNKIVLIDFGAVKQVRMQQPTLVGQASVTVAIGTPGYMPTEQSSGKPRPSSDIYAVGMVGIQALTGRMPTELPEDEDGEVVWQDQATVGDSFAAILNKMVRHYFKHRYQTAAEVLQALHHLNTPTLAPPGISPGYLPPTQVSTGSYPGSVPYTPTPLPTNPIIPSQASPPAYPTPLPAPQTPAPIPYTPTPLPGTPAPLPHLSPPIPATGITPPRQEAGLTPSSPPSIPNIPQTQSVAPVMPTEAIPSIPPTQTAPDGFPYGQPSPTLPSQPNYGQPVYGSPGEYGQPGYSPIPQPQNLAGPQTTPLPGQNRSPQSNPLAVSKDPGASKRLLLIGGAIALLLAGGGLVYALVFAQNPEPQPTPTITTTPSPNPESNLTAPPSPTPSPTPPKPSPSPSAEATPPPASDPSPVADPPPPVEPAEPYIPPPDPEPYVPPAEPYYPPPPDPEPYYPPPPDPEPYVPPAADPVPPQPDVPYFEVPDF